MKQMNLGLALSALPHSSPDDPRSRAASALRQAHAVFGELGLHDHQKSAAYNLGIFLASVETSPVGLKEAIEYLEGCLPWLDRDRGSELWRDALRTLSDTYVNLLEAQNDADSETPRCMLASLDRYAEEPAVFQAIGQAGIWLFRRSDGRPERLDLARVLFERVLKTERASVDRDARAAFLGNLATICFLDKDASREASRARGAKYLQEAIELLSSLPATPDRARQLGLLFMNQTQSGLER